MKQNPHRVKILDENAVKAKLRRMAYEIYEKNYVEEQLVMIGLGGRGNFLATQMRDLLHEISPLKVTLWQAKKSSTKEIILDEQTKDEARGKVVVIVDDVLYSGLTMFHALASVMERGPSRVQIAVLIDRGHRNVPVSHDFVGMELATSLQQYVSVEVDQNDQKAEAYLF